MNGVSSAHHVAIAGAAQVVQRPDDGKDLADRSGPIELMIDAARGAARDAGAVSLLRKVEWIGVVGGWWRYRDPGRLLANAIGANSAATALTSISGSAPQELVGVAAERIQSGGLDVALVVGGEARWTARRLKRVGQDPTWIADGGVGLPEMLPGLPDEMISEASVIGQPATAYALFGDSRRHDRHESVAANRDRIARLWAVFSNVAANNRSAWDRGTHTPSEIREASPSNRMIAFPYTKAMVAKNTVDMSSAVLLCSVGAARAAGVPLDRLVFPQVTTAAHETWRVVNRNRLHRLPALATAGHTAFQLSGLSPDEIAHFDLYACFPAMVQLAVDELGLDDGRPLTVTGGLGFAGAPVANSSGQAIAAMVPLVRSGGAGFVHANGGMATKHAIGIYTSNPPATFRRVDVNDDVEHHARPDAPSDWSGRAHVEAATATYDGDDAAAAFVAVQTPDGRRCFGTTHDSDVVSAVLSGELTGHQVNRGGDGSIQTA